MSLQKSFTPATSPVIRNLPCQLSPGKNPFFLTGEPGSQGRRSSRWTTDGRQRGGIPRSWSMAQVESLWRKAEWTRTAGEGREWIRWWGWWVFQVGMDVFQGRFFLENDRKIGKVRKWKELKSWRFLWLFSCIVYQHGTWEGRLVGSVVWSKELPTFAQQWNRKREVCSIFWDFLVLGRRIKTFAPSEPYQPWLVSERAAPLPCRPFARGVLWWIWWWIKASHTKA